MMMLTGIKAFEARWQSLKATYPTAPHENHLLMQSMGRLIDNYATQSEIAAGLPFALRSLFDSLVDAYLNGYWAEEETVQAPAVMPQRSLTPAMVEALQRQQQSAARPASKHTVASEAATYIIHDRVECKI